MGAAFKQFKESLTLATALRQLERDNYSPSPRIDEQPFVKGLRGGAAVLMVAAFEFFLKRLFEENISKLNNVPVTIDFNKLPDQMKVKAVFHGLDKVMKGPLYEEKSPRVDRITDVMEACKLLITGHIDPGTFSETGSNPSGSTVRKKFKEVGIDDIFHKIKPAFETKWGTPVSHDYISDKLDEIVRTRHVVAHTADTLNITRTSQNESLKFMEIISELLEKELEAHIKEIKKNAKK